MAGNNTSNMEPTAQQLRDALYGAEVECEIRYAEAFYFRPLAMRIS